MKKKLCRLFYIFIWKHFLNVLCWFRSVCLVTHSTFSFELMDIHLLAALFLCFFFILKNIICSAVYSWLLYCCVFLFNGFCCCSFRQSCVNMNFNVALREWTHLLGFTDKWCALHTPFVMYVHVFYSFSVAFKHNRNGGIGAEQQKKTKKGNEFAPCSHTHIKKKRQRSESIVKEKLLFSIHFPHKSINLVLRCRFCWHTIAPKNNNSRTKTKIYAYLNSYLKIQKTNRSFRWILLQK